MWGLSPSWQFPPSPLLSSKRAKMYGPGPPGFPSLYGLGTRRELITVSSREMWWGSSWWIPAFFLWVGSWLGLSRSLRSSLGPIDQGSMAHIGLFWTNMILLLGLMPRVWPVPRVGPGYRDCTGRRNVEPVLWGPESRLWW